MSRKGLHALRGAVAAALLCSAVLLLSGLVAALACVLFRHSVSFPAYGFAAVWVSTIICGLLLLSAYHELVSGLEEGLAYLGAFLPTAALIHGAFYLLVADLSMDLKAWGLFVLTCTAAVAKLGFVWDRAQKPLLPRLSHGC